ncbi:hexosaminidase [Gelidibacter sediminis]|uniref:beta-N-acetylhexosaminidase n=1 Tax=Gelidibacter sediminis TaxID=1608710 RepID=A0A4R7Q8D8_9FLAO|nr:glycoside hydrolase family 20 protein [Gelidibacter sediminis]TDU43051.1 hexosaminidase [Gelidibacter sediminis]
MSVLKRILVLMLVVITASCQEKKETKVFTEADIAIIPKPVDLQLAEGVFEFNDDTQFVISEASQKEIVSILSDKFKSAAGWTLKVSEKAPQSNYIEFISDDSLNDEAYELVVNSDKVTIKAKTYSGFLYGLETIRQLLPVEIESKEVLNQTDWVIPNLIIKDEPRFKWRGLHLDVSRHFFEKSYIKETIDMLAMHKMNVFHFHLVDDQGWRIEIKKYPKLTEIGAFRNDQEDAHWDGRRVTTPEDEATYGGFYTQEDIKEIVAYAKSKGVQVVPEIEMPAHVMSAIAAYPELSCFETPIGVPSGGVWPITEIYCAGKESTFEFLENVLLEVMELFPSEYIHVGGDEATKTNWAKCPHCQKRMKDEGLANVEELQSYFIKRMERFISSHDRKLIGWDEILEGGLAPEATVMSWRGVAGGLEAAEQGHDVVMTPGSHMYFDHYQGPQNLEPLAWGGYTPLSKVYEFDPVVETMTPEQAKHVLGGQANVWSEQIKTEEHSQYMIFPRLAALSEAVWSPKASRNWDDFSKRILSQFKRYDYLDVNYAKSAFLVMEDVKIDMETKEVSVELKNEFTDADIRYSLNDEKLTDKATKYTQPLKIDKTTTIHASLFKDDQPVGVQFSKTIAFHKAVGKKVTFKEIYDERYQGEGEFGLVNTLRGTKNFQDGHWQAWLAKGMEAVVDLGEEMPIHEVILGTLENQGPGIYFPTAVKVYVSNDGKSYKEVGVEKRPFAKNPSFDLKDFKITFDEQSVRYVKVVAESMKTLPNGGDVWLFVDEIVIN